MQNTKLIFILCLLFSVQAAIAGAQTTPHPKLTKALKDSLKTEIDAMMVADQKYRWMLQLGEMDDTKLQALKKMSDEDMGKRMRDVMHNKVGISAVQKDSLGQLQSIIDTVNFIKMTAIIYKFGYPKKYVSSYTPTTILGHAANGLVTADLFKVLREEVRNKNMPPYEYAELYDMVQLHNKQPELYYVIEHGNPKSNSSEIWKPKDLEATNKARREIGLKEIKE